MARSRPKTRRHPRSNPRGVLHVMAGGYGFVKTAEGEYFIPSTKMGGAFDGDTVEIIPVSVNKKHKQPAKQHARTGDKPTGRVIRVVNRAHEVLIGRYEVAEPFGIIVPEDSRIPYDVFTMRTENPHVKDGDIVKVRITAYPTRNTSATGMVEEVIGHEGEASLPIEVIIARHKLETAFSEASLEQAREASLDEGDCLAEGYRDIRDRIIFTIDPEDARDYDDAVSLDEVDGLYRLGVHIADVSRFVPWNSSVDLDARRRATSVYLVDRVIPMLPEELSADLCSLKPGETKATMTVDMYLDDECDVVRYEIYPSLIVSSARFTYDEVQDELDRTREALQDASDEARDGARPVGIDTTNRPSNTRIPFVGREYTDRFTGLHSIAAKLARKRRRAGGIDFMTAEAKVKLDEEGKPQSIVVRKKTDATEVIEESMVLANTTVAIHLRKNSFPGIYRIHDVPATDALSELVPIIHEFDYLSTVSTADFVAGNPFCIQQILELCKDRPEEELLSSLILRAMKRAVYQSECSAHYGLAKREYLHFTSPIRRYPDLVVHRMVKAMAQGKPETFEQQVNSLPWLASHASDRERIADVAARDSQEVKIVEYLEQEIGTSFDAVISGVASYGFFVRLENTAEGLVGLKTFGGEYFSFDPKRHTLTGEESGTTFRLGQRVSVVLERADARAGHLDFRVLPACAVQKK